MLNAFGVLIGQLTPKVRLVGRLDSRVRLVGTVGIGSGYVPEEYTGSYEVVPTRQDVTLGTADKLLTKDVIVKRIPSNYGLITWDGATLTVS